MHLGKYTSRFSSQPLTQSIILQNQSRLNLRARQIAQNQHYQQVAIESFPFGKEGIKISEYVSNQLNSKQQQENARILEEFRRKAVEDKFHNKYGHLKNSRIMQKYITENMLPGVTLNPSIAGTLGSEMKNNSAVYHSSLPKANLIQHYTSPTHISPTHNDGHLFNARYRIDMPLPYNSMVSYSTMNPEKTTINSEVQKEQNSPQKQLKQIDLQRKYYKLKLQKSKKQLKKFDKLQKMLQNLNRQIRFNSKFIEDVIVKNENEKSNKKRGRTYTLRNEFQNAYDESQSRVKYPRARIKTESKKDNEMLQNWKLNNQILYSSSTSSSFFDESGKKLPVKPKVKYTLQPQINRNLEKMQNFVKPIKSYQKPTKNKYESTRDYRLKDQRYEQDDSSQGIEKIRNHLKLLKRHTDRLQTINSYSLVQ